MLKLSSTSINSIILLSSESITLSSVILLYIFLNCFSKNSYSYFEISKLVTSFPKIVEKIQLFIISSNKFTSITSQSIL